MVRTTNAIAKGTVVATALWRFDAMLFGDLTRLILCKNADHLAERMRETRNRRGTLSRKALYAIGRSFDSLVTINKNGPEIRAVKCPADSKWGVSYHAQCQLVV
jgi:hypothetical protein